MGGYQQLVRCEPFRGKYRNSFEHPKPFVPNEPYVHKQLQPHTTKTRTHTPRALVGRRCADLNQPYPAWAGVWRLSAVWKQNVVRPGR
jgi:hypothetical protein